MILEIFLRVNVFQEAELQKEQILQPGKSVKHLFQELRVSFPIWREQSIQAL